jgi:two-component system, sensor histidine kinase
MAGPLTRLGLGDESPEQRHQRITAGVMASVYRQVPQSVLGNIFGSMALVAAFWSTHDQNQLLVWFIGMLLESLLRLRAARAFRLDSEPAKRAKLWASRWVSIAVAAGLLWGAAGSLFFTPGKPLLQLVLLAVVLGVTFGSLTLYAGYRRALFFFLPLAVLPLIVRMVGQHDAAYYSASIVLFAVFLFTLFFGRSFGETMSDAVKKNYENEVLVEQLLNEKRLAEEARRAAENAIRSKTQFFAAASHDLRQPLQAIGIYCSLLRKRAQGPLEPLTKNLSAAVESLSKLVEELLEISRLDSGAVQARPPRGSDSGSGARACTSRRIRCCCSGCCGTCCPTRSAIRRRAACCWRRAAAPAAPASKYGIPDPGSGATNSTGYSRSSIVERARNPRLPADMVWACRSFAGSAPCWAIRCS